MRATRIAWLQEAPSPTYSHVVATCSICGTFLSRYNPDDVCARHELPTAFDVDAFIDACRWPSYLPDPRQGPPVYTSDELAVLRVLSHHVCQWVHLNYVLIDGGRQVVNNTVRKLRRKGFTIEGRRSGGYLLRDRVPPLE